MFMYSYCYVCSILCIVFHCVILCIVLCVNVYSTTATGCQPNCSQHIYQIYNLVDRYSTVPEHLLHLCSTLKMEAVVPS